MRSALRRYPGGVAWEREDALDKEREVESGPRGGGVHGGTEDPDAPSCWQEQARRNGGLVQ